MDIFDQIELEEKQKEENNTAKIFWDENTSVDEIKNHLSTVLDKFQTTKNKAEKEKISSSIKSLIDEKIDGLKAEIRSQIVESVSKIKPPIQKVIERVVEQPVHIHHPAKPTPSPEKIKEIIKEIRIEAPKDPKTYAEEKTVEELKKQIEELKQGLKATQETLPFLHGGSGVIGIPAPEGNNSKVLTVVGGKATWQTATGGSGNVSTDVYTPSNVVTDRSFDATLTSLDEIANVLGSLIASLQGAGIIQ